IGRAMTSATHAAIVEQRYAACRTLAIAARDLYRVIGDRESEADVLVRQASAAARLSMLAESRQCYEEAVSIYRSIGKRLGIAAVLVNSGIQDVRVGRLAEAERSLREAATEFAALKDLRGETACALNLSFVSLLRGDGEAAKASALQAVRLARSVPHAGYEAAALANLGSAERELGDLSAAAQHMKEGLAVRARIGESRDYADELAQLMLVQSLAREHDAAREQGEAVWSALESVSDAIFMPHLACAAAAKAFDALGDVERASALWQKAHALMESQASVIPDGAEREMFLSLPAHREIETRKSTRAPKEPSRRARGGARRVSH
ncbi:MAG TPA: tetratricopeptide repeat protein, partial [Candidatus Eremiobacteraceae bacterium]|nr:tetratricopeptide repeat protein [Candidatus Eremiobacteraceae bacterium]